MKKYLVLLLALMFSAATMAQAPDFDEVDSNGDGVIDRTEAASVEGLDFDEVDANQDGIIDRQEYEDWADDQ